MQQSIASTLQILANNEAKQIRISKIMADLQRAKTKYDDAVAILDPKNDIVTGIESDPNIADKYRRDAAKTIYRAQVTINQRAKTLHPARAGLSTHGHAQSLDTD